MGWSWHVWVSRELQIGFWRGNLRESPPGIPVCRWEDNIKVGLQAMVWGLDWIDLAEDRDAWGLL